MNRDVPGSGILLEMLLDGEYFPVFCAQTGRHNLEQEEIETTDINSGSNKKFVPGMASQEIEFGGLTRVDNADGRVSILYLMQESVRRLIYSWRMTLTDNETPTPNVAVLTFDGFIKITGYDKNTGSLSKCNVTIRVTGGVSHGSVIPDPSEPSCEVQLPLYLTMAEGDSEVSDVLLEQDGVDILRVQRSGLGLDQVAGTPVAGTAQFRFIPGAGNGTIQVDPTNPANPGGEIIYVLYRLEP